MQPRWTELPPDQLESIYNPRAASPNVAQGLARRKAESEAASRSLAGRCQVTQDLRYGSGEKETLDLYQSPQLAGAAAPLAVFLHGGYWRGGDKSEATLVVPALLDAGAVVANVNYDLCPVVSLDAMVAQVIRAVRYCHANASKWHANPDRLLLMGHSAGAHLAARVMNSPADEHGFPADAVASVVAITGIYDPEVITKISVNDEAQIDVQTARRNECLNRPPNGRARYAVWAGGDEPPGWVEQSRLYAEVVRAAGFECEYFEVPGADHFTVLCESFIADSPPFDRIRSMLNTE
ncbi:MAG: alpha/beta hydrolase [Burkholderiaceae bacterium]